MSLSSSGAETPAPALLEVAILGPYRGPTTATRARNLGSYPHMRGVDAQVSGWEPLPRADGHRLGVVPV